MPSTRSQTAGDKRKHDEAADGPQIKGEKQETGDQQSGGAKTDEPRPKAAKREEDTGDANGQDKSEAKSNKEPKAASKQDSKGVLDWLLSDEAFDMANPEIPKGHGEVDWDESANPKTPPPESAGKHEGHDTSQGPILRYPHSSLTPFQNLVAACLLSKPISHKLGLRTIQTLLNPPFGIRTLSDLDEAGYEGRRKVMWEARTQHKEKTASQLGDVCEGIRDLCGNPEKEEELSEMKGIREQVKDAESPSEAAEKVTQIITKVKGIGPGVAAIFLRRVQADWEEVFPFADDRSLNAARDFDLIGEGDGAEALAEKVGKDRSKYARLLDTLVGLDLEKVVPKAKESAGVA